jgi:ribonuclease HII
MEEMNKFGLNLFQNAEDLEAGLDECARGCLLGRTYTAVVIWSPTFLSESLNDPEFEWIHQIRDSKKVTPKKREQLSELIKEYCLDYSIQYADENEIDTINILNAVQRCFHSSLTELNVKPDKIFVDGNVFIPYKKIPYECVEKGDNKYISIASASILAKVEHDKYIAQLCQENPELNEKYDIGKNMGYGTSKHLNGIKNHGITQFHRKTFGCCKNY